MAVYLSRGLFDALSVCLEFSTHAVYWDTVGEGWMLSRTWHTIVFVGARMKYAYKNKFYIMPS